MTSKTIEKATGDEEGGKYIDLGFRLNHLIDQNTELKEKSTKQKGLRLPNESNPGTGTVVIIGEPGSGKSTLAMQIAVAAAAKGVGINSAYISLEEEAQRLERKAKNFGWCESLCVPKTPNDFLEGADAGHSRPGRLPEYQAKYVQSILEAAHGGAIPGGPEKEGKIILPGLLPRPIEQDKARLEAFYWSQYSQIELLVRAARAYEEDCPKEDGPHGLGLIVIDSLNMIGIGPDNREMLFRLFDLLRQNQIMGVFTTELSSDEYFDSTLGDVVFKLTHQKDAGYDLSLIECAKSRFTDRTRGVHPYKIKGPPKANPSPSIGDVGLVVYPSVHAVVKATEKTRTQSGQSNAPFPFGWGDKITKHLLREGLHRGSVVALAGPYGTFKTHVGVNFLLNGLVDDHEPESSLYIRLQKHEPFKADRFMAYCSDVIEPIDPFQPDSQSDQRARDAEAFQKEVDRRDGVIELQKSDSKHFDELAKTPEGLLGLGPEAKAVIRVYKDRRRKGETEPGHLIVVDFPTGMLLTEEVIDITRQILDTYSTKGNGLHEIRRVVLDDVASIGVSYPLLKRSLTANDLFLSSFVHVVGNYNNSLLLIGTTGELEEANHMTNQACSLADGILTTSVTPVFGDKYVLLSGDGMFAKQPNAGETPPVVLLPRVEGTNPKRPNRLQPDAKLLDEFVGFDSGPVHRPGITLHMYKESEQDRIVENYYQGLKPRLSERYGEPHGFQSSQAGSGVEIKTFFPGSMYQFDKAGDGQDQRQSSRGRFREPERPRDHTSVRMIDEFEKHDSGYGPQSMVEPYCRNVQLIAYRTDLLSPSQIGLLRSCTRWEQVKDMVKGLQVDDRYGQLHPHLPKYPGRRFIYSAASPETSACLVLDAISTCEAFAWPENDQKREFRIEKKFVDDEGELTPTGESLRDEFLALFELMSHHVWARPQKPEDTSKVLLKGYRAHGFDPLPHDKPSYQELGDRSADDLEPIDNDDQLIQAISTSPYLPPDAAVYVCWYSQLRGLIYRAPWLAGKMDVTGLPGKGFKGDWSLRVEGGSVSLRLGQSILKELTTPSEDFERFRVGVGMPAIPELSEQSDLLAWPGAETNIRLAQASKGDTSIYRIWSEARQRSSITNYRKINRLLYTCGDLFARGLIDAGPKDSGKTSVHKFDDLVRRLPTLLNSLKDAGGGGI